MKLLSLYLAEYDRYWRRAADRRRTLKTILNGLASACLVVALAIIMLLTG